MLVIGRKRRRVKSRSGFTMVELTVVIVIILVLAAVLVPSLLKYIDKAQQARCMADAATLLSQIQADYAAGMAQDHTGSDLPDTIFIGNVVVENTGDNDVKTNIKPNTAEFSTMESTGGYREVTSFAYNNGIYIAVWRQDAGWELLKSLTK